MSDKPVVEKNARKKLRLSRRPVDALRAAMDVETGEGSQLEPGLLVRTGIIAGEEAEAENQ